MESTPPPSANQHWPRLQHLASVDWPFRASRLKISTELNAFISSEDVGGMFYRAQPILRPHQRFVTVPLRASFRRAEVQYTLWHLEETCMDLMYLYEAICDSSAGPGAESVA